MTRPFIETYVNPGLQLISRDLNRMALHEIQQTHLKNEFFFSIEFMLPAPYHANGIKVKCLCSGNDLCQLLQYYTKLQENPLSCNFSLTIVLPATSIRWLMCLLICLSEINSLLTRLLWVIFASMRLSKCLVKPFHHCPCPTARGLGNGQPRPRPCFILILYVF